MSAGVRIEYAESYSIVTRSASGEIRETEYSDDDVFVYITSNGLLETAYEEPASDVSDRFEYTFETSDLVPPEPWSGQQGEQISRDKSGAEVDRLGFSYHARGSGQITIGDCQYDMIPVQTYYENPDERTLVEFVYLLELGLPVVVGYGGPGYFDPHRPQAISVIE